jgi:N utilization substance protein B
MVDKGTYRLRTDSRRRAFQLLFASEVNELPDAVILKEAGSLDEIGIPCDFSRQLFLGTRTHLKSIDAQIAETAIDWELSRLPLADKSILRLAIYEMLYENDVPVKVAINEAVELAKDFGGSEKSANFVNGVLGRIADSIKGGEDADAEGEGDNRAS